MGYIFVADIMGLSLFV